MWLLLLGGFYETQEKNIYVSINHPIFKNVKKMLYHELGHLIFEKFYKPKARNFLHHLWIEYVQDEMFAIKFQNTTNI